MARVGGSAGTADSAVDDEMQDDDLTDERDQAFEDLEGVVGEGDVDVADDQGDVLDTEGEPVEDDGEALDANDEPAEGDAPGDTAAASAADGVDRGDGRDATGKFVSRSTDRAAAGDAGAAAGAGVAAATPAPQWEPYQVGAVIGGQREAVPFGHDIHVLRQGDRAFITLPASELGKFNARIAAGHTAERVWHQLQAERHAIEEEKAKPPRMTDEQIEAEVTLEFIKPLLSTMLDADEVARLETLVENRQLKYAREYEQQLATAKAEREKPMQEREAQTAGLAAHVARLAQHHPSLAGQLTPEEVVAVFEGDLFPVIDSIYRRQGDQFVANEPWIVARLQQKLASRGATSSTTTSTTAGSTAASPTAAAGQTPGRAATGAGTTDAAERFNRGQNTAARRTTDLRARRGQSSDRRSARAAAAGGRSTEPEDTPHTEAARADRSWNKTKDSYLRSNSLDFEDDEEG